jgi:hypothetical protein
VVVAPAGAGRAGPVKCAIERSDDPLVSEVAEAPTSFPDPTRAEARALIVGLALFWGGWGPALALQLRGFGSAIFLASFAGGIWFYVWGVLHIAARQQDTTTWAFFKGTSKVGPRESFKIRRGWDRLLRPSYFRRASRVLAWNETVVLGGLAVLFVVDLVVAIWTFTGHAAMG